MKFASCIGTCVLAFAIIFSAFIIRGGLRQLSRSIESSHTSAAATTRPATETMRLLAADEPLAVGDLIETSVNDLAAQGVSSTRVCRLGNNGTVRLWYINEIAALGHGSGELEDSIAKAYRDQQILPKAQVVVTARRPIS